MRWRFPLLAKILTWFFLNLVVLGAGFFLLFKIQFRLRPDSLLAGRVGERITAVSGLIAEQLRDRPRDAWEGVLARFGQAYKTDLFLFRLDGSQLAGQTVSLPPEVEAKVIERRGMGDGPGRGPPPGRGPRRDWDSGGGAPSPRFMLRTASPGRYWVGVQLPLTEPESTRPWPVTLLIASDSLFKGGLFFDLKPWIIAGTGALMFSILFWFPLVRGLTRNLSQMTRATEDIARGQFDTRVDQERGDELGRLGQAINRMAERLSGFVTGQKRFLGDIAHELCSPLARIQVALGILEQNAEPVQKERLADLAEEVQEMSDLVNELLSFSKAGLQEKAPPLEKVALAPLVRGVLEREHLEAGKVRVEVQEGMLVLAQPNLLSRALANLVRNALRYAGADGPVVLHARERGDVITLSVEDNGPGVPEEALERIFDPFYRGEASRSRETGGVGLGLAIVKTCIEACQGQVVASNRVPRGLSVQVELKRAPGRKTEAG